MSEKRWDDAAQTYKQIMDMGVHSIDSRWIELFQDDGEMSDEIIYSLKFQTGGFPHEAQRNIQPFMYGGWHEVNVYDDIVKQFEMTDGELPENSPLFNEDPNSGDLTDRFANRDPRLAMTVFLPEGTVFKGRLYVAHPDSSDAAADRLPRRDWSGYALKKFADENYDGSLTDYGGDLPLILYAEVLLS